MEVEEQEIPGKKAKNQTSTTQQRSSLRFSCLDIPRAYAAQHSHLRTMRTDDDDNSSSAYPASAKVSSSSTSASATASASASGTGTYPASQSQARLARAKFLTLAKMLAVINPTVWPVANEGL